MKSSMVHRARHARLALALLAFAGASCVSAAADEPLGASRKAAALDPQIDWGRARLIAVQDAGRYKTLDSFAREMMQAMYGAEHFPGLSPLASLMEWLFNNDAYADAPVIRIKDRGLRIDLSTHMADDRRERILRTGRMTPREFMQPSVQQRLAELEPRNTLRTAINRVREAEGVARDLQRMACIVPQPGAPADGRWFAPEDVLPNLAPQALAELGLSAAGLQGAGRLPVPGLAPDDALAVLVGWSGLRTAWLAADAGEVQRRLDALAALLPTLAAPDVYPSESQRAAEAQYYRMGKFTWGWMLYFAGMIVSVWALVTRWRLPWMLAMALLVAGMGFHAYGVGLRWYILGRIPIANMFEAVIGSAWLGVAVGVVLELAFRSRVFLLAANATGFLALMLGGYVIPGGGTITTIMGILDDVMLRIHTLLIIWSYALIFLAAVIAVVYLIGYYASTWSAGGGLGLPTTPLGAAFVGGGGPRLRDQRPLLAGAAPGDETQGDRLPLWLHQMDWCHLIILNLVFVMLFVGTILGAVWADYSWGRPWGWDPKEVFAMNTWIVYAVLIHTRFFVQNKGLWTAWLSIAGCLMMAFNWFFVNFYIVGLHSYA